MGGWTLPLFKVVRSSASLTCSLKVEGPKTRKSVRTDGVKALGPWGNLFMSGSQAAAMARWICAFTLPTTQRGFWYKRGGGVSTGKIPPQSSTAIGKIAPHFSMVKGKA